VGNVRHRGRFHDDRSNRSRHSVRKMTVFRRLGFFKVQLFNGR